MSTDATNGQPPEQHSEPMAEAGCEAKIDRSVQGTVAATGFAEQRFRAHAIRSSALLWRVRARHSEDIELQEAWSDVFTAVKRLCMMLDDRADAKDETRQE